MPSLTPPPSRTAVLPPRRRGLFSLLAVLAGATIWGACASQIGLDGVEYDRRLCGADGECNPPTICRGNAIGTFYCEPAPADGQPFGQPAIAPTSSSKVANCASGVDVNGICTRPCRNSAQCGGSLPTCKNLPLKSDPSRSVAVCQK
jgi:hypothetical protein